MALLEVLQKPNCSLDSVMTAVSGDAALTAKLLQVANSGFFGTTREVSNVREAVLLMGFGMLRSLSLSLHLFSAFDLPGMQDWSQQLWRHSMRVGKWAKELARMQSCNEAECEQAYTAGILHDVGKLILADTVKLEYARVLAETARGPRTLEEVEMEILHVTHSDAGAYLLDLWGLPVPLVEAVAWHHNPGRCLADGFSALTAVHVADVLDHASKTADLEQAMRGLDTTYLSDIGLRDRLPYWQAHLRSSRS
jgi:putative nucleotidyltransferase with HDIG domain